MQFKMIIWTLADYDEGTLLSYYSITIEFDHVLTIAFP